MLLYLQNMLASKKHNCNIRDIVLRKKKWRPLILLPTSRWGAGSSALKAVSKTVTLFVSWYFKADLGCAVFIHVYQATGSAYWRARARTHTHTHAARNLQPTRQQSSPLSHLYQHTEVHTEVKVRIKHGGWRNAFCWVESPEATQQPDLRTHLYCLTSLSVRLSTQMTCHVCL